jgi:hypothetical protein
MTKIAHVTAFKRGIEPLVQLILRDKAAEVATLEGDPQVRARIEELAEKSTEGTLTTGEQAEYGGYIRANKFVAILKRRARELLESAGD